MSSLKRKKQKKERRKQISIPNLPRPPRLPLPSPKPPYPPNIPTSPPSSFSSPFPSSSTPNLNPNLHLPPFIHRILPHHLTNPHTRPGFLPLPPQPYTRSHIRILSLLHQLAYYVPEAHVACYRGAQLVCGRGSVDADVQWC